MDRANVRNNTPVVIGEYENAEFGDVLVSLDLLPPWFLPPFAADNEEVPARTLVADINNLPMAAFAALVRRARTQDASDAYDTKTTFIRGARVNTLLAWDARPAQAAFLRDVAAHYHANLDSVKAMDASIYNKRCRGVRTNGRDFILYCAPPVMRWFDATNPAATIFVADTDHPAYKRTCRACCNRLPAGEKMQCCGNCRCARYCNVECQRRDWDDHKGAECRAMREDE